MTTHSTGTSRRAFIQYGLTLGVGVAIGGVATGRISLNSSVLAASTETPDATATREAEIKELNDLRTQVANPPVCTPIVEPTPTEAPLANTGVPLSYRDIWTITVHGIAPLPGSDVVKPAGQFMQINLAVSHSSASAEIFPYVDFVLSDAKGRFAVVDQSINRAMFGNGWLFAIQPGVTEERSLVFDVAADAGNGFLLESQADSSFRVGMTLEQRG
jgi:hypothetical protein